MNNGIKFKFHKYFTLNNDMKINIGNNWWNVMDLNFINILVYNNGIKAN